jgi:hypothetical protein
MKTRPTQFGVRENTASSRQHAPRRAMNASVLQPDPLFGAELQDKGTQELPLPIKETFELSLTQPNKGATGEETEEQSHLGYLKKANAQLSRVHPRTVKRMARAGKVPGHFRFGRWYFYASELDCWMRMELHSPRHP